MSTPDLVQQFQFVTPYRVSEGKIRTTLRYFRLLKGVYMIKEGESIIYVGMSGHCVYKALYRHFERWNDPRIERQVYLNDLDKYQVAIIASDNFSQLEKDLIRHLHPRDNREYYETDETDRGFIPVQFEEAPF